MKKFLIVVDMQKDFVDGALGTAEAVGIVPAVCRKIENHDGEIILTLDTHEADYLSSSEGKHLPVEHCIKDTEGWCLDRAVAAALKGRRHVAVEKPTFGSTLLPGIIKEAAGDEDFSLELCGLCTDICVVSNALYLKANFPEVPITVDSACCAGVTPESHRSALETMKMCQIEVI